METKSCSASFVTQNNGIWSHLVKGGTGWLELGRWGNRMKRFRTRAVLSL